MPRIPDMNLRVCFFLYPTRDDAEMGSPVGGCGAFVRVPFASDNKISHTYAITNEHLFRPKTEENLFIRINTRYVEKHDIIETELERWHLSDTDDIAVIHMRSLLKGYHHITCAEISQFLDESIIKEYDLGIGDEVFAIGRFLDIDGSGHLNRPVIRFGSVSLLDPYVSLARPLGSPSDFQDSYLVEMRSRTGFSGSMVLIYIPAGVFPGFNRTVAVQGGRWYGPWVLGLHWGQLPIIGPEAQIPGKQVSPHLGSGMTAVVPAERIRRFLMEDPAIVREREEIERAYNSRPRTQEESATSVPFAAFEDENPDHQEDFRRLVGAASKKRPPDPET